LITGVSSAAVLVNDAKSAEWYRDKLGFEIVWSEGRFVTVKPKGSKTLLPHLCAKCDSWGDDKPGGQTGIWLQCGERTMRKDKMTGRLTPASNPDDVKKTYLELKENGVEFAKELTVTSWGATAILKDPDGSEFEIS
jgi:catechol 2,3-dioxygenase-like lactoylglutathione lyase family enzyme